MMESTVLFENIHYTAKVGLRRETRTILKGLNGKFPANNLIAILGPSGSGKSTLLNILGGCIKSYEGNVVVKSSDNYKTLNSTKFPLLTLQKIHYNDNCEEIEESVGSLPVTLGYIQQETELCGLLTVQESFQLAAKLKIAPEIDKPRLKKKIKDIIETLGLTKVVDIRVSCISGGEKKRVAIGLELLSDFSIILLDEPTTGLDIVSTQICVEYLKHLAVNGTTVICTIHQPSATLLQYFDYLYILADGKCLYEGENNKLLKVLDEYNMGCPCYYNPADYIVDIASGEYGTGPASLKAILLERFHFSRLDKDINHKQTRKSIPRLEYEQFPSSSCTQLKTLLKREYIKAKRNPTLTYLRLLTSVANSLVLCAIFWKVGNDGSKVWFNYNALLGFVLHLMMPSLMLTILTFPTEYKILKRECANRWYSLKWYYAAVTIIDLPICVIYCLISNGIFYYLSDQPLELWRFSTFTFLGFLICIIAQSFGLLVGSLLNVVNGTFFGSALTFPMMLFAGFGMTFKDIPPYIRWIGHFSYLKYGVEGFDLQLQRRASHFQSNTKPVVP